MLWSTAVCALLHNFLPVADVESREAHTPAVDPAQVGRCQDRLQLPRVVPTDDPPGGPVENDEVLLGGGGAGEVAPDDHVGAVNIDVPDVGGRAARAEHGGDVDVLARRRVEDGDVGDVIHHRAVALLDLGEVAAHPDVVSDRFHPAPKQGIPERPVMSRRRRTPSSGRSGRQAGGALPPGGHDGGLRRGELLGVPWEDRDLDKGTLRVRGTKTEVSRRPAVLPAPVADALRRHRATQLEEKLRAGLAWHEHGMVFPTTVGTPQSGDNVLSRSLSSLKPIMARPGLPTKKCFQYLRRSAATFLVLLKVHPRDAMRWLGHSNIQTTMNVYAQASDEMQEETARLMADLLFGPDKPSIDRQTPVGPARGNRKIPRLQGD